jgi:hypothetical protein
MSLLGLELSDAGIMVAAKGPPRLLELDEGHKESPAFAFPEKNRLLVGREAESLARVNPVRTNTRFWDRLGTEPLKQPSPHAQSHAEIAFAHLSKIWERVKEHGNELVMAVPGFLSRYQLGLIRGMSEDLAIPLRAFVPLAVAAAEKPCPESLLLHVDIHLHRVEIVLLEQGPRLRQKHSVAAPDIGLQNIYKAWVEAIAAKFVRETRYDPLHQATSEQELYDRLPHVLAALESDSSMKFEMRAGVKRYRVNLSRRSFVRAAEEAFRTIGRLIVGMRDRHGQKGQAAMLQLTHRIHRLPGCTEILGGIQDAETVELAPGAGAFGVLYLTKAFSVKGEGGEVSFVTSRPWHKTSAASVVESTDARFEKRTGGRPTHLLYRNMAYPISVHLLVIGKGGEEDGVGVQIRGELAGVSRRHCSIQLRGDEAILTDHSTYGTFVDETRVSGTSILRLGQIIRVGTPGEELQLIASVEADET